MKYTLLLAALILIGCTKEQDTCQCRTVTKYRQWGTNMTEEWETVGSWQPSEDCRESVSSKTENFLTITTRVECTSR